LRSATSASRISARGSSGLPAKSSAIGPRAQATAAGTSSATVTSASGGRSRSAARSVKPMPSPPMRMRGFRLPRILAQESPASASSEPLRRLFINSLAPSIMENSAPRRLRRSSSRPPGTVAESSCSHGIMHGYMLHCARRRQRFDGRGTDPRPLVPPLGGLLATGLARHRLLTEADILGHRRPRGRIVRRRHRIVGRQTPFGAVLLRRQAVRRQVTLHRLELLAVLKTDDVIGVNRFLRIDRRY